MSEDLRLGVRVEVNDEFASIDVHLSEYVSNISRGGIFLRCEETLPIGTEVELRFTILVDDFESIEGQGLVVHHGHGGPPGLGIRFLSLTDSSRKALERLMELADEVGDPAAKN
jgi:uncharacterized protein (TIGR02266 family)